MFSLPIWLFIGAGACFGISIACVRTGHQLGFFWITLTVFLILLGGGRLSQERAQRKALENGQYWLYKSIYANNHGKIESMDNAKTRYRGMPNLGEFCMLIKGKGKRKSEFNTRP